MYDVDVISRYDIFGLFGTNNFTSVNYIILILMYIYIYITTINYFSFSLISIWSLVLIEILK